jgi:hypothetical protein
MSDLSDTILCWGVVNFCLDELKKPASPFEYGMPAAPPSSHAYADPELEHRCEELERRCKALERRARVPTIDWWESLEDQQRHYRSPRIQHWQQQPVPAVHTPAPVPIPKPSPSAVKAKGNAKRRPVTGRVRVANQLPVQPPLPLPFVPRPKKAQPDSNATAVILALVLLAISFLCFWGLIAFQ